MKAAIGATVVFLLLGSPAFASPTNETRARPANAVLAQASPSPVQPSPSSETRTASPSPGAEGDRSGISTGAGLVIAAFLIGGLLLMRSRLLRR